MKKSGWKRMLAVFAGLAVGMSAMAPVYAAPAEEDAAVVQRTSGEAAGAAEQAVDRSAAWTPSEPAEVSETDEKSGKSETPGLATVSDADAQDETAIASEVPAAEEILPAGADADAASDQAEVDEPLDEETTDLAGAADRQVLVDYVTKLYQHFLGREPDAGGLNDWVQKLSDGKITGAGLVNGFVFSKEFQNKPLSNTDYIAALYRVVLGREPDAAGAADWAGRMKDGMTRKGILAGFINSAEFQKLCDSRGIVRGSFSSDDILDKNPKVTAFVTRLYRNMLFRDPDTAGLKNWVSRLLGNYEDGSTVSLGFFNSAEFTKANLSNEDFLKTAYRTLLNREPDASGWCTWMTKLNQGASRQSVLNGMLYSDEFKKLCASYGITAVNTLWNNPNRGNGSKVVYLTFDDGPGKDTNRLLDILAKYNVKATFFTTNALGHADCIAREAREGHEVGVHTLTHDFYSVYASSAAFWSDHDRQNDIIRQQTGSCTKLMRFPGGSSNTISRFNPGIMSRLVREAEAKGYDYYDWNVQAGDAGETTDPNRIYSNIVSGVHTVNTPVVLCHDSKSYTVDAIERVIRTLLQEGYTFAPLSYRCCVCHHPVAN